MSKLVKNIKFVSTLQDGEKMDRGLKIINPLTPWVEGFKNDLYKDRDQQFGKIRNLLLNSVYISDLF